jgi:hypothetical protein
MVGVIVTFRYGADFDAAKLRKVAEMARPRFEGMPGLRSKVFTVNADAREATNFYVWDAESAARQFFTDELLARVTGLYGVRPSVTFVEIAAHIDNAHPTEHVAHDLAP